MSGDGRNGTDEYTPVPRLDTDESGIVLSGIAEDRGMRSDDILELLAEKIASKGGGGGGGPPEKKFLFLTAESWIKLAIGWIIASGVFVITWYNTVNDEIKHRTTNGDVKKAVEEAVDHHAEHPHPVVKLKFDQVDKEIKQFREVQIQQTEVHKQQTETLQEIKQELRRQRRRR